ncbi:hypothetical protein ABZS66_08495 [Dactylosporangium sp. NPDC005572]|uniref:hypothetical protein n=1 Tax=Dactylosporangium sp. NPDC005572 TaxID=3156889 RepID=UPI00339ECE88
MPHPPGPSTGWSVDLSTAFEELFDAFGHRPKPANPKMCVGHCINQAEYEAFCRTAPRDLDDQLIDRYWWNESDDWDLTTHFMPAILRAMPSDPLEGIRDFSITSGLNIRWPDLTERERAAVESFCRAWFADVLGHRPTRGHTASRVLEATAAIGLDISPYLTYWETVGTPGACWQLDDMVPSVVSNPDDSYAKTFCRWLLTPAPRAMIAECGRGELTDKELEWLEVVARAANQHEEDPR